MKSDRRGSWYLLTGAVLGIAIGLYYSWVISPVKYYDAPPYALRADYKDGYRALVAAAYLYSGDLLRAEDRLAQLKDMDTAQSVAIQAQRALAERRPEAEVKALGMLALALGESVTPDAASTSAPPGATPTPTGSGTGMAPMLFQAGPAGTVVPTPGGVESSSGMPVPPVNLVPVTGTLFPSATPGAAFTLQETKLICNPDQLKPLIQVQAFDAAAQPVPYLEVLVTWDGGTDHFFTGLKPELGLGYGDFEMSPGVSYAVKLASGGQGGSDLTAAECLKEDGSRYWGAWMLRFVQP